MKKSVGQFIAVFFVLLLLAITEADHAMHRVELMMFFVLMLAAVLFWKRLGRT